MTLNTYLKELIENEGYEVDLRRNPYSIHENYNMNLWQDSKEIGYLQNFILNKKTKQAVLMNIHLNYERKGHGTKIIGSLIKYAKHKGMKMFEITLMNHDKIEAFIRIGAVNDVNYQQLYKGFGLCLCYYLE